MLLIFISSTSNYFEHLMCLLAICISFFGEMSTKIFCSFFNLVFCFINGLQELFFIYSEYKSFSAI